jgi:hypothetical protein
VARDLDIPRAALGDTTLTYLSASPTALYLGAKYAEMFPRRLRAAVLDGAVDLALDAAALDAARRPGSQRRCAAFCSPAVLRGLVEPRPPTRTPARRAASPDHGCAATGPRTRRPGRVRPPAAVRRHIAGRNAHGSFTNELEARDAVNCLARPAADGHARSGAGARRPAHVGDRDHPRSSHPVHLGRQARPAAARWLLTYDGDGHTAYQRGSGASDTAVDAHLIDLRLPPPGTRCS